MKSIFFPAEAQQIMDNAEAANPGKQNCMFHSKCYGN